MATAVTSFSADNYVATNNSQQQSYCDQFNREAAARYTLGMTNYNNYIDAVEKLPPNPPPTPEKKWVLTTPDADGLQWQTVSATELVCGPISAHAIVVNPNTVTKPPNHISIGHAVPGSSVWFDANPDDGVAGGQVVPGISSDGVTGMFERYTFMFANGYYLKVG